MGVLSFLFPTRKKKHTSTGEGQLESHGSESETIGLSPVLPASQLLSYANSRSHQKEDWIRKIIYALDLQDEEVDLFVKPVIERLAAYMQHIPASQSHHHAFYGGLFWHSLEVGYLCARAAGKVVQMADTPKERMEKERRWRFAAFLTGAFHDIGKVYTNVTLLSDKGESWNPLVDGGIPEWLQGHGAASYDFTWNVEKNSIHESYAMPLMLRVLDEIDAPVIAWLTEYDKALIEEVQLSLAKASSELAMARFMIKADSQSVANDLQGRGDFTERSAGGTEFYPMISHALQNLAMHAEVNSPGAEVYLSDEGEVYIALKAAWEKISRAMSAYDGDTNGKRSIPGNPDAFLEVLAALHLVEPKKGAKGWWYINPDLPQVKSDLSIPVAKIRPDHPLKKTLVEALRKTDPISIKVLSEVEGTHNKATPSASAGSEEGAQSAGATKNPAFPGDAEAKKQDMQDQDPLEAVRGSIPEPLAALGEMDLVPGFDAEEKPPEGGMGDEMSSEGADHQAEMVEQPSEDSEPTETALIEEAEQPAEREDSKQEERKQAEGERLIERSEPVEVEKTEEVIPSPKTSTRSQKMSSWEQSLLEADEYEPLEQILGHKGTEALRKIKEITGESPSARFILRLLARLFTGQDELGKHLVHVKGKMGIVYPDAFSVINALKQEERIQVLDDFEKQGLLLKEDDFSGGRISTGKGFKYVPLSAKLSRAILEFLIRTNRAWDPAEEYWQELLSAVPSMKSILSQAKSESEQTPQPAQPDPDIGKNEPLRIIQPGKADIPLPKDIKKPSQALKQLYFQANARGGSYIREPFEEYEGHFKLPKSVLDVIAEVHGFDRNDLLSVMTLHEASKVRLAKDGVIVEKINRNRAEKLDKPEATEEG